MGSSVLGSWTDLEFLSGYPRLTETQAREQTSITARISSRGYEVRLSKLNWPGGGEIRMASSTCWLNTILTPPAPQERRPLYQGTCGLIHGPVVLAPPDAPILVRWKEPEIQVLTCLFDPGEIVPLAGLRWDWATQEAGHAPPDLMQSFIMASDLLAREMRHPDLASEIKIESLVIYIACQLHSRLVEAGREATGALRLDVRQLRLIRDLAEDHRRPPTASDIAGQLGMTPRTLGQLFRATTGATLRSYLAGQRVDHAKRLLATPGMQIKSVAARAGFNTTSAFAAAFRRSTGLTPQEYRASGRATGRA